MHTTIQDWFSTGKFANSRMAVWGVVSFISLAFTAVLIGHSLSFGHLALPPTYDDVVYFLDGIRRLDLLYQNGVGSFLSDYAASPPHAPLSTFIAMAGFAAFGFSSWGPHLVNGLILTCFLWAYVHRAQRLPTWASVALAVILLSYPLASITVMEFRPDALCGLLTACGTLAIIWLPWAAGDRKVALLAGVLFGAALLAKPAVMHVTLVLFGLSMLLTAGGRLIDPATRYRPLSAIFITVGFAALIIAPHYAVAAVRTVKYIYDNTLGGEAPIWKLQISPFQHGLYYLTGSGGSFANGLWLAVWPVVAIAFISIVDRSLRPKICQTAVLMVVCYLVVSIPVIKSPFIGISLSAYFLITLALMFVAIARRLIEHRQASTVAIGMVAFAFLGLFDFLHRRSDAVSPKFAAEQWRMINEVADTIATAKTKGPILQTAVSSYINLDTLSFALRMRGIPQPPKVDLHRVGDSDVYRRHMKDAQFAIAFDPSAPYYQWLPSAELVRTFLADLKSDSSFELASAIRNDQSASVVYVFRKK